MRQGLDWSWNFGSPDWPKFGVRAWQWHDVEASAPGDQGQWLDLVVPWVSSAGLGTAGRSWWLDLATGMDWGWGGGQMAQTQPERNYNFFYFIVSSFSFDLGRFLLFLWVITWAKVCSFTIRNVGFSSWLFANFLVYCFCELFWRIFQLCNCTEYLFSIWFKRQNCCCFYFETAAKRLSPISCCLERGGCYRNRRDSQCSTCHSLTGL